MSNETCVITIADIYGAEWWSRNKAELDREWEWEFGVAKPGCDYVDCKYSDTLRVLTCGPLTPFNQIRIILHRRKPKPPTLREVYGVDRAPIPAGWEWTGEWRPEKNGEDYLTQFGDCQHSYSNREDGRPRLILRERPKKVWFKAEEKARIPHTGDWFYSYKGWVLANTDEYSSPYICATRHEEVGTIGQVVTQADIDALSLVR